MRLSDAGLRRRKAKLLYPNHRPPPWLTEDATRDRSNRLLGAKPTTFTLSIIEDDNPYHTQSRSIPRDMARSVGMEMYDAASFGTSLLCDM
jgi:hypothetical protein